MQNNEQAIQEAMRLAQSPEGKRLMHLLQSKNADALNQALSSVSKGDYTQAQKILSSLLTDPETRDLLNQFGG